jgi:hypothetical protein
MFYACCGIIIFAVYITLCETKRRAVGEAQRIVMKPKKRGLRQTTVKRGLCHISEVLVKPNYENAVAKLCCR